MIEIKLILFAVLYGIGEQYAVRKGWRSGKKIILNQFSWYHFIMGLLFVNVILLTDGDYWHFPLMALIEDITFFLFGPFKLDRNSWVTWGLGGIDFGCVFIPTTYMCLIVVSIFLKLIL